MQPKHPIEKLIAWIGTLQSIGVHTVVFACFFLISALGFASWSMMLLILTTILSLEAIYLALFIQMTVNRHTAELAEVSEDVEDIQEDIDEIQEDVEDIQEDIKDISDETE